MADEPGTNTSGAARRGVPRKLDQLGRVVIPSEYRKVLGMAEGDLLDLTIEGDAVVVRRVEPRCGLCGGMSDLFAFRDRYVCGPCARALASTTATS